MNIIELAREAGLVLTSDMQDAYIRDGRYGKQLERFAHLVRAQALDALADQQAARAVCGWIPKAKQMPTPGVRVFWMDVDSRMVGYDVWAGEDFLWMPSHWMPIPDVSDAAQEAPQPAKQPLTDEEIDALELPPSGTATVRDLVRLIERAHGINVPQAQGETK